MRRMLSSTKDLPTDAELWMMPSDGNGQKIVYMWKYSRERGLERIRAAYPPSFYMHQKDLMPIGR
jgi:hypothetical protein